MGKLRTTDVERKVAADRARACPVGFGYQWGVTPDRKPLGVTREVLAYGWECGCPAVHVAHLRGDLSQHKIMAAFDDLYTDYRTLAEIPEFEDDNVFSKALNDDPASVAEVFEKSLK